MQDLDSDGDNLLSTSRSGKTRLAIKQWWGRLWIALPFLVLVAASLTSTIKYGPQGYRFVNNVLNQPYAKLYAPAGDESAVVPLFDQDTLFDVAVTIWQRSNCTAPPKEEQGPMNFFSLNLPDCDTWPTLGHSSKDEASPPAINETVLYSQVVLKDFNLGSKAREATISFELPPWEGQRWLGLTADLDDISQYNLRAAVMFIPQTPSLLDQVLSYTAATPEGMIVPTSMGEGLVSAGWGDEGSVRRQVLDALTVHVPLLRWNRDRTSMTSRPVLNYINRVQIYVVDEVHPLRRDAWLTSFRALQNDSDFCAFPTPSSPIHAANGIVNQSRPTWLRCRTDLATFPAWSAFDGDSLHELPHLLWMLGPDGVSPYYYSSKGHYLAKYELESGSDGEDVRLAYNPFMGSIPPGPSHWSVAPNIAGNDTPPWYDLFELPAEEDQPDVPQEPVQAEISFQMSVFSPIQEKLQLLDKKRLAWATGYGQSDEEDVWTFSNGLIGNPVEGAHTWRRMLLLVINISLAFAVALLTVLYWYTRKTATGISHWSIWMRVAVVLPKTIYYVRKPFSHMVRGNTFMWIAIITTKFLSEFYQLRLVFPIDLGTSALTVDGVGRAEKSQDITVALKIARRKWTRRERTTMHLEPKRFVAIGVLLACIALSIGWAGFISADILQLVMNHRTHTFAGTYALVAYLQLGIEVCHILYNFSFIMGKSYEIKGLSFLEVSSVVSAIALVYQAATLPRVEQVVPDDEEE